MLVSNVVNLTLCQSHFFSPDVVRTTRNRPRLSTSLSVILEYSFRIRSLMSVRTSLLRAVICTSSRYYESGGVKVSISKTRMGVVLYVPAIVRRHLFYTDTSLVVSVFVSRSSLERCYIVTAYVIVDFTTTL